MLETGYSGSWDWPRQPNYSVTGPEVMTKKAYLYREIKFFEWAHLGLIYEGISNLVFEIPPGEV
jgi:hypothetical protein